eukprot:TRINITY_DN47466_c0_g1_i1.p1 TRINITY_DN47466_c0_g1~~TRINITY_DN47466_c0_g1_i1.p1  ORF type:complete len:291 (+),score=51.57 TRINITY_DN47466_c0_g1_i1:55-927(+)
MAPADVHECALSEDPARYLWRFGFRPPSRRPVITLTLQGHAEVDGRTMYKILCKIRSMPQSGPNSANSAHDIVWTRQARLADLREHLHDPLKDARPEEYKRIFKNTPFASRGGIPGTTDRLNAWMATLASWCTTPHSMPASTISFILRFLQAPVPYSSEQELVETFGKCEECAHHTGSIRIKACRDCECRQEETAAMKLVETVETVKYGLRVAEEIQAAREHRVSREHLAAGEHSGMREPQAGEELFGSGEMYVPGKHQGAQQVEACEELRALGADELPSDGNDHIFVSM